MARLPLQRDRAEINIPIKGTDNTIMTETTDNDKPKAIAVPEWSTERHFDSDENGVYIEFHSKPRRVRLADACAGPADAILWLEQTVGITPEEITRESVRVVITLPEESASMTIEETQHLIDALTWLAQLDQAEVTA